MNRPLWKCASKTMPIDKKYSQSLYLSLLSTFVYLKLDTSWALFFRVNKYYNVPFLLLQDTRSFFEI